MNYQQELKNELTNRQGSTTSQASQLEAPRIVKPVEKKEKINLDRIEDLEKLREKNHRQSQTLNESDLNRSFETFDASKKSDKIEPFESVPAYNVSAAQLAELKKQFLVNKTENGYYELYPLNIAYDRIINNGFQADQFKNYWGIDPKQVKDQLGPLMTAAKEQYDVTVTNKIIDQAVREGKTVSEAVKSLPASIGNQKALKQFIKPAQDQINKAFDYARRNKSGIGQSVERMTNQGVDYAIRSKSDIERAAKNYSDQGFDYLRRNKNEIGRQANNLISNAMGRTTKRAGAMSKSLQSKKKNNKYF
jgi:hypothetical protein